ncbi:hypothetical protein [Desulfosoma caldarium]|uniref:Uncharacterized protein n=1 Tax=Desulfosoma caldarium TaxID=610254 RepID=A0A3N1UG20_9BACT|nr:hypothetical protein [Desulfosoma caldarium]ROQ90255.1 hypothetical protein EDC27_2876 [Desulfosoma caldarium]
MRTEKPRLLDFFESHHHLKLVLSLTVLFLLILETLIYLTAASQAGQRTRLIITNTEGQKVYETTGSTLSSYEKMVFESTFGPLDRYRMQLHSEERPFPFRAWLSAAVGIPVGLILIIAFAIKAFLSLLYGDAEPPPAAQAQMGSAEGRLGSVFELFRGISVFHVGILVVVSVILFWMVPNLLGDFGRVTWTFLKEYKILVFGGALFLAGILIWIIYLRYRLSKQVLQNQVEIEKLRLEYHRACDNRPLELLTASHSEPRSDA